MKLTDIFEAKSDWQQQALKDLKAEKLPDSLFTELAEGVIVEPIYHLANELIFPEFREKSWISVAKIDCSQPKTANQIALKALNSGANGIIFDNSRNHSIDNEVFDSIHLQYIENILLAQNDQIPNSWLCKAKVEKDRQRVEAIALALKDLHSNFNSNLSRYAIWFELSDSFFLNVASVKALKILSKGMLSELNVQKEVAVLASTTTSGKLVEEVLISNPIQAMSAVLGGADMLYVEPHEESEFGRRIALNVSNLLKDEAHLDKFSDPAAGSYFLSNLTAALCQASWKKFTQILD